MAVLVCFVFRFAFRLAFGACVGLATAACIQAEPFACEDDEQCMGLGQPGRCVEPGFCAHPDEGCPSGLRFSRFASEPLASTCTMPTDEPSSSTEGSSSEGSSSEGSSTAGSGSGGSSSSGDPIPVDPEECDGIDNDGDGLVDEWSEINEQCNDCDLFQHEGSAYWRCSNGRWTDVQPVCESFGANLASIQSADENLFLALRTLSGANWIGINDIGDEGVYTWVDGAPLRYTNWSGGTPPGDNLDANCGGINTQGEWSIFNCTNSRAGFCEAPHPD
ncbi:MAG: C-type lectin domain-containing protein [Myxococcota bacterium]